MSTQMKNGKIFETFSSILPEDDRYKKLMEELQEKYNNVELSTEIRLLSCLIEVIPVEITDKIKKLFSTNTN